MNVPKKAVPDCLRCFRFPSGGVLAAAEQPNNRHKPVARTRRTCDFPELRDGENCEDRVTGGGLE